MVVNFSINPFQGPAMPTSLPLLSARYAATFFLGALLVACGTTPVPIAQSCSQPLDPKVENSCVVSPQILWRGARPDAEAASTLLARGVGTVVNLEWFHNDRSTFEAAVIAKPDAREIPYFQIRDWEPLVILAPSVVDDHVAHFLAVARTQPKPLYVHCRSGQNRTGVMVAAYQIFNGADIEETVLEMQKYGGFWAKPDAAYLRTLTPQRRVAIEKRVLVWMKNLQPDATISCSGGKCSFNTGTL